MGKNKWLNIFHKRRDISELLSEQEGSDPKNFAQQVRKLKRCKGRTARLFEAAPQQECSKIIKLTPEGQKVRNARKKN